MLFRSVEPKKVNPREIRTELTELTESGNDLSVKSWIVILASVALTLAAIAILNHLGIIHLGA